MNFVAKAHITTICGLLGRLLGVAEVDQAAEVSVPLGTANNVDGRYG